ncbi:MAG: sigma-70 family RNA polymerase sigma factor [Actinomycetota bacterium]|nr:sigma-70 family RNA polymerase sigma factor [Actinomycetota bacterium]
MPPLPDAEILERLLARDERSFRSVVDRYGPAVFGIARRVLADGNLAEEVTQDTFVALWRRPGAFDPERGTLQSFLLVVARNKAVDLVRKEEARKRATEILLQEADAASGTAFSDEHPIEDRDEIRTALARLSAVQREAIVLAYFGGRTYREVAQELGVPEGTAKTRLRDGLTKLREVLSASEESRGWTN